eukprot:8929378-Lingulodinium_polyedra.AAC.1
MEAHLPSKNAPARGHRGSTKGMANVCASHARAKRTWNRQAPATELAQNRQLQEHPPLCQTT